jgi:hypothetical protein
MGAKVQKMSFAYQEESRKPVAAKVGINEWFQIPATTSGVNELTSLGCPSNKHVIEAVRSAAARVEALSQKELINEMENEHLKLLAKLAKCDPSSSAKYFIQQDVDDVLAAQSLHNYVQDNWNGSIGSFKIPIPGEKEQCIKSCDDRKDALDVVCGVSAVLNPWIGAACFATNWAMRGVCRSACGS